MFAAEAEEERCNETDEESSAEEQEEDEITNGDELTELEETESDALSEAESIADADEFDEEHSANEMDFALHHVRDLAASRRAGFVNTVCDIIAPQCDQEPTTAELYGVFGAIKQSFAEALEESDSVDAESDYESVQQSDSDSEQESDDDFTEQDSYDPEEDSFDYMLVIGCDRGDYHGRCT